MGPLERKSRVGVTATVQDDLSPKIFCGVRFVVSFFGIFEWSGKNFMPKVYNSDLIVIRRELSTTPRTNKEVRSPWRS